MKITVFIFMTLPMICTSQTESPICISCNYIDEELITNRSQSTSNGKVVWLGKNKADETNIYIWDGKNVERLAKPKQGRYFQNLTISGDYIYWSSAPSKLDIFDRKNEKYRSILYVYDGEKIMNITDRFTHNQIGLFGRRKSLHADGSHLAWFGHMNCSNVKSYSKDEIRNVTGNINGEFSYLGLRVSKNQLIWHEVVEQLDRDGNLEPTQIVNWFNGDSIIILNEPNAGKTSRNAGIVDGKAIWEISKSSLRDFYKTTKLGKSSIYISDGNESKCILNTNNARIKSKNKGNSYILYINEGGGKQHIYRYEKDKMVNIFSSRYYIHDFAGDDEAIVWSSILHLGSGEKPHELYYFENGKINRIPNSKQNGSHNGLDISGNIITWNYNDQIYLYIKNSS